MFIHFDQEQPKVKDLETLEDLIGAGLEGPEFSGQMGAIYELPEHDTILVIVHADSALVILPDINDLGTITPEILMDQYSPDTEMRELEEFSLKVTLVPSPIRR